jgi:hypothetical protein
LVTKGDVIIQDKHHLAYYFQASPALVPGQSFFYLVSSPLDLQSKSKIYFERIVIPISPSYHSRPISQRIFAPYECNQKPKDKTNGHHNHQLQHPRQLKPSAQHYQSAATAAVIALFALQIDALKSGDK